MILCIVFFMCVCESVCGKPESSPRPGESAHQGERRLTPVVKCALPTLTSMRWLDEGFSFTLVESIYTSALNTLLKVVS